MECPQPSGAAKIQQTIRTGPAAETITVIFGCVCELGSDFFVRAITAGVIESANRDGAGSLPTDSEMHSRRSARADTVWSTGVLPNTISHPKSQSESTTSMVTRRPERCCFRKEAESRSNDALAVP
jgi:hypothetical protein